MKLRYKILWIEDDITTIKIKAKNTRSFLENDYGFECQNNDIEILNYDEFKEQYVQNNEVKSDMEKFDLLLVDFDLGEEGKRGDELIEIIRKGLYSEILFYSSNREELQLSLNNKFIDGVFTSNRSELEDKIRKLIKVTIKKVQDLNNLRGLMMAETSELDEMIKDKIFEYVHKCGYEEVRNCFKSELEASSKKIKQLNSSMQHKDLDEIFKHHQLSITMIINTLLEIVPEKSKIKNYEIDVIHLRNLLAHTKVEEVNGVQTLKDSKDNKFEFTSEKCIDVRKTLQNYKENIKNISFEIDDCDFEKIFSE